MQAATPAEAEYRPPSLWMSIPVILLCLGAGGYIISLYVKTRPLAIETTTLADVSAAPAPPTLNVPNRFRQFLGGGGGNNGGGGVNARPPTNRGNTGGVPFIRMLNSGTWEAQTAKARMGFGSGRNGQTGFLYANYKSADAIPREAKNTAAFLRDINLNAERPKVIADMNLTADQIAKLQRIPRVNGMSMLVAPADRALLGAAYAEYQSAAGRERGAAADKAALATATEAAQAKLFKAMDDVADRSAAPTRDAYVNEATAINAVITPDQWKIYVASGNGH